MWNGRRKVANRVGDWIKKLNPVNSTRAIFFSCSARRRVNILDKNNRMLGMLNNASRSIRTKNGTFWALTKSLYFLASACGLCTLKFNVCACNRLVTQIIKYVQYLCGCLHVAHCVENWIRSNFALQVTKFIENAAISHISSHISLILAMSWHTAMIHSSEVPHQFD